MIVIVYMKNCKIVIVIVNVILCKIVNVFVFVTVIFFSQFVYSYIDTKKIYKEVLASRSLAQRFGIHPLHN